MKTTLAPIQDIIDGKVECPLAVSVIPNHMGINLCSVEALSWKRQDDGQLVDLTIHFIPAESNTEPKSIWKGFWFL
jgi:hypothetical protein